MPVSTLIRYHGRGSSIQRGSLAFGRSRVYRALYCSDQPALELSTLCRGANGAARQETALVQEGVEVGRGDLGERTVDFSTYGWFPDSLPSNESEDES